MGVTSTCTSTTWNRAVVGTVFGRDTAGFVLTDRDRRETYTDGGLTVNSRDRELLYQDFSRLPGQMTYYWSLPAKYLGDKVGHCNRAEK